MFQSMRRSSSPGDVRAVVGEFQARDARPALALADEAGDDRRQRREPQAIQLAQQLAVEQRPLVVAHGASSRTPRTTALTMSSAVTPLRSASNVRISRCRSAGSATARTSSYERWLRPAISAETLPGQRQRLRAARARPEPDVVAHELGGARAAAGARSRCGSRSRARARRPGASAPARPCAAASRRRRRARARGGMVGRAAHDRGQLGRRRVVEVQLQQEAVELRLRQRVGALHLDRVLGREHRERPREVVRVVADRDRPLLHRLEQRALRARRGAVDLVGQDQAAEERARLEHELRRAGRAGRRARPCR